MLYNYRIKIYPVESVNHLSNNLGLKVSNTWACNQILRLSLLFFHIYQMQKFRERKFTTPKPGEEWVQGSGAKICGIVLLNKRLLLSS